ncbi:MAG: enoyl-CoA hydratase/isomerase family protein [Phycisphaerales bacterium JB037]
MTDAPAHIAASLASGIGRITLDRPDRRNALTPKMLVALADAAERFAATSDAGAILLEGQGRSFCAGFDLDLCRDHPDGSMMRSLLTALSDAVRRLRNQPLPVVINAHGAAIAGGCALLGGADAVISHPDAKLGYPVTRLGVSPAVTAPFLLQDLGPGVGRRLLLDPGLISGEEAHRLGLVSHLAPDADACRTLADELARTLSGKPRAAAAETRAWSRALGASTAGLSDPDAAIERGLSVSLGRTGSEEERSLLERVWSRGG